MNTATKAPQAIVMSLNQCKPLDMEAINAQMDYSREQCIRVNALLDSLDGIIRGRTIAFIPNYVKPQL